MANSNKQETERWGKKIVDNRDWPLYNEQLVRRGEYFLDLDFVKGWDKELAVMNENKVGAPYHFPNSLIQLQAVWHAKKMPYRMIEGLTRKLVTIAELPDSNHYSTANRRINKLSLRLELPASNDLTLFADGTSLRVVEGGEYLREKYGKKNRRWVQVVIWGDPVTKEPVDFEVNIVQSSELDSAKRMLAGLVDKNLPITAAGGDGSFDEIDFWNWLDDKNIQSLIKPDCNALTNTESELRNLAVAWRNRHGYKKWRKKTGYGERWVATEGIFSAIKTIFGEEIHARSEKGILQEAKIKFWAYQKLKRYGKA